jgi:hypothetical protein
MNIYCICGKELELIESGTIFLKNDLYHKNSKINHTGIKISEIIFNDSDLNNNNIRSWFVVLLSHEKEYDYGDYEIKMETTKKGLKLTIPGGLP